MFAGRETEDVTLLLNHVQRAALAQSHQRDDEWCADYASTCLFGEAMRFYAELESETQESWRKLRLALLVGFPQSLAPDPPAAVQFPNIANVSSGVFL